MLKNPTILTADQIVRAISYNPAWAQTLTEPVEVHDYVNLRFSKITHLSEFLIFKGQNSEGYCANFQACQGLQVALGQFHGGVNFSQSAIKSIAPDPELFLVHGKSKNGVSADFSSCQNLEIATGKYVGAVDFGFSNIKEIIELEARGNSKIGRSTTGICANFDQCQHLKVAKGTYFGFVDFSGSGITSIDTKNLNILDVNASASAASFAFCKSLQRATGNYPGFVNFRGSGISSIGELHVKRGLVNTEPEYKGTKIDLRDCFNLKEVPIYFDLEHCLVDDIIFKTRQQKTAVLNRATRNEKQGLEI